MTEPTTKLHFYADWDHRFGKWVAHCFERPAAIGYGDTYDDAVEDAMEIVMESEK